ncbi:hypothetical protein IJJ02_01555 [Candidatus Saccharibacteria bacterium]|nr:hypothetical protein [Candidatus Saccharibacteria bacterium]
MKSMKKCKSTKQNINHKRRSSAGMFYTSSAGAVTSLILCLVASLVFSSLMAHNTSAVGTVSLTVSSDTIGVNIAPTMPNGTFAKSDNVNISASTDNSTGYTLMLAANSSTDYNKLKNGNEYLTSVTSPTTEEAFKSISGTAYNNMWGYLPSKYCTSDTNSVVCSTNTDFLPAPNTSGDILDKTSSANTTANDYTLAIGARVDNTTKMGSYTNTYNVILVANEVPYSITYYDSIISNMPVDVVSASSSQTVNISNNTPTRDGYTFLGWCTIQPTTTNGVDACTGGTTYSPGQAWTLGASDNNLSLYAMWGQETGLCSSKDNCMQFVDRYRLSTLMPTVGSTTTLYDMRDGQAYTVALLADGKYWMTKNLNLPGGTTLHDYDTNMPAGYTLPTANNFQSGNRLPASSTTGFDDKAKAYVYNSNSTTCGNNSPCYSYYSWTAATIGSGLNIASENTDAPYSICPKGWRLPTSGNSQNNGWKRGDFYQLATNYGVNLSSQQYEYSATFYNNAGPGTTPSFLLAGGYASSAFYNGGTRGYYWSSTSYDNNSRVRRMYFYSGGVESADNTKRDDGGSVRCVFAG